jgi:hypothetical protein
MTPRSPCVASAGCRKNAAVPVLVSVAAILRLAHAGQDDAALAAPQRVDGRVEARVEPVDERHDGGRFGFQDLPGQGPISHAA